MTVLDQELMFRNPTAVQASMLHRLGKVMDVAYAVNQQKDHPRAKQAAGEILEAMGKILDLFGSLLAPGDEAWLATQMLTGKVSDEALLKMLQDLAPEEEEREQAPKTGPRKVRRG